VRERRFNEYITSPKTRSVRWLIPFFRLIFAGHERETAFIQGGTMSYPPYIPYQNFGMYQVTQAAKHDLRRTANRLCWTLIIAMFGMSFLTIGCQSLLHAFGITGDFSNPDFNGMPPVLYYLSDGMGYVVGLAVPVLLFFAIWKIPLDDALAFHKAGFAKTAACVFFGTAVCMLANIPANIVVNLEKAMGFSGKMPEMPLTDDPSVLVLYFITIAVIPPVVEELMFRGMILHGLRRFGDGFAIVASALLFGLYHGNFVQFVFAFLAGLAMALVVVRTGSLWTSILIHFVNNSISVGLEMVQRYYGEGLANQVNYAVMAAMLALGLFALIWLMIKEKRFFRLGPPDPLLRMSAKLGAVFSNPGGVALLLIFCFSSIIILTRY